MGCVILSEKDASIIADVVGEKKVEWDVESLMSKLFISTDKTKNNKWVLNRLAAMGVARRVDQMTGSDWTVRLQEHINKIDG